MISSITVRLTGNNGQSCDVDSDQRGGAAALAERYFGRVTLTLSNSCNVGNEKRYQQKGTEDRGEPN